ncbi:MAG: tRNA (adenosine(37)-N6)-dimethylallyltransferase MiaA [Clostridia bacterium]|nr:tRNA (adenosine(37)-N6)-dimethylallyltransferase MiaA [Clostridia bacterium]
MKRKAIVVVGPTASGKTSLGIHICKKFNGEVISADSMQIYKGLEISTAKPTPDETDGIKHHLIDFLDVMDNYSVSSYCKDANCVFDDIISRGKLPVIVGGTGLYIDSFLTNTEFIDSANSEEIRNELKSQLEKFGCEYMHNKLMVIDPVAAEKIHPNNTVRVLRALEVYKTTGVTITQQNLDSHKVESDIEPLYIGISYNDREKLYERINRRVDVMLSKGLLNEAKAFFDSNPSKTAFNSIGCKELKPYFDNEKTLDECIEQLKRSTRRYAKRQLTWFKRNNDINWVYPDLCDNDVLFDDVDSLIKKFLEGEAT